MLSTNIALIKYQQNIILVIRDAHHRYLTMKCQIDLAEFGGKLVRVADFINYALFTYFILKSYNFPQTLILWKKVKWHQNRRYCHVANTWINLGYRFHKHAPFTYFIFKSPQALILREKNLKWHQKRRCTSFNLVYYNLMEGMFFNSRNISGYRLHKLLKNDQSSTSNNFE